MLESLDVVVSNHVGHELDELGFLHRSGMEPAGDGAVSQVLDAPTGILLSHGDAVFPRLGVCGGGRGVEVACDETVEAGGVFECEFEGCGAAHGYAYEGVKLWDTESVDDGEEVVGEGVESGGDGWLWDRMAATGIVAEDAEKRAVDLEDVDEGVPHVERGEERVAEGDGGSVRGRVSFKTVGDREIVWGGDERGDDGGWAGDGGCLGVW